MKKFILPLIFALLLCLGASAQSAPLDSVQIAAKCKFTGEFHVNKAGKRFHIFVGGKGGRFILRKSSKMGLWYKDYLPKFETK